MDDKVLNRFAVSQFLGENRILDQSSFSNRFSAS